MVDDWEVERFAKSVLNCLDAECDPINAVRSCEGNPGVAKCNFGSVAETLAAGHCPVGTGAKTSLRPMQNSVTGQENHGVGYSGCQLHTKW